MSEDRTTAIAKRENRMADAVERWIDAARDEKAAILPKDVDPDRFWQVLKDQLRTNYAIRECTPESVYESCLKAAQFGLEVGVRNIAHMVKYGNKAQLVIGYEGKIFLGVCRAKTVKSANVVQIRKADKYEQTHEGFHYRIDPFAPTTERGPVIGYYAEVELVTGGKQWATLSVEEYHKRRPAHWDRQSKAGNYGPHVTHPEEMHAKGALHKVFARVPLTPDVAALIQESDAAEQAIELDAEVEVREAPPKPTRGVAALKEKLAAAPAAPQQPEAAQDDLGDPAEPPADPGARQGPPREERPEPPAKTAPLGTDLEIHKAEAEALVKDLQIPAWGRWSHSRQLQVMVAMRASGIDSPAKFWHALTAYANGLAEEEYLAVKDLEGLLDSFERAQSLPGVESA